MKFRDLSRQYDALQDDIERSIRDTLSSGTYIGGDRVSNLEKALAEYVGVSNCIACGNGTDALQLALMAWGIGPGDAVIVPDFTFFSSGEVVATLGATPIFVDVDERTFNIDASQIEPAYALAIENGLSPKAVIPVDLFGLPADYPEICAICKELGLLILEDGAQGFGGSIQGKMDCSFGDVSTTSFFPAKPLGCYGDGGAVFTNDNEWAALIRSYAVHGKGSMKYDNVHIGMNSRLDTIQAAILEVKLKAFINHELDAVNEAAKQYSVNLSLFASQYGIILPQVPSGTQSSWAQYTIVFDEGWMRDRLRIELAERNIPTMVYYPKQLSEQLAFVDRCLSVGSCNVSKRLCRTVLSLPIGPYITENEINSVCNHIQAICSTF